MQRTNVDWCFPMPIQYEETIKDVATLYIDGDKRVQLRRHQVPVFTDEKLHALKKYSHGGKILDRLSSTADHFVLNDKDKLSTKGS